MRQIDIEMMCDAPDELCVNFLLFYYLCTLKIYQIMANNMILERLEGVKSRFIEVGELLTQPDILSDMKKYVRLNKEYKDLLPIVESYERYKLALSNITSTKELLATEKDEEMREMAKAELDELTSHIPEMEEEIKMLIIPADPEDDKTL